MTTNAQSIATYWLQSDCILITFCLPPAFILTTFWLYFEYILRHPAVWLQRRLRAHCRALALGRRPCGKHLVCSLALGPIQLLSLISYSILVNKHAHTMPWFPVPLRCPLSMLYVGLPKGPFGPLWNVDKPATFGHLCLFYWCVFWNTL